MLAIIILLVVIGLIVWFGVGQYNTLIAAKNKVENDWSNIDVQLKRRVELIPNLVNTVKGAADYEKSTLSAVTEMRTAATEALEASNKARDSRSSADMAAADTAARNLQVAVNAVHEAYPQLTATANFRSLQEELTSTEERVAYARQAYNDSVMRLNTLAESFPSNMFVGMAGVQKAQPFEVSVADREAPKVQF